MERKSSLDADTGNNFANRKVAFDRFAPLSASDQAFENLNSLFVAFANFVVNFNNFTNSDIGNILFELISRDGFN